MRIRTVFSAGVASLLAGTSAFAEPVPRQGPISGRIVATKQGETAVLLPTPQQRPAEVRQDIKAGDVLRTNAAGTLAIVFADRTQIRIGRNSTLVVKQVRKGVPSSVSLQGGSLWARSPRGASQFSVETPSATAAIRGTEYSIIATEEQTTLTVVEGVVDFFNTQGRLEVRDGQSAAARLGQTPTRIFTVNPDSREQMLYYVGLNDAISYLRPAPLPQRAARAEVDRVKAIPAASRTAEDWLTFAESGAEVEHRTSIEEALKRTRSQVIIPTQEARAKLVEANNTLRDRNYPRALQLFEAALPELTGRQKEVARYGIFVAKTLASPDNPGSDAPSLDENQPVSYVGQAFVAAYLGDFDRARSIAEAGLKRFPDESSLYSMLAAIGILTGDQKAMEEASRQALLADPHDPFAIRVQTELELSYRGNPKAAIASAERAVALAPAGDDLWNSLAEAYSAWGQERQSERAFKAGIAETPNSFILHGNYALTLLQQGRIAEGREQLAIARSIDPDNALVDLTEGFLDLSEGRHEDALSRALDATAANPSYSDALLLLAELYYNKGEFTLAAQQVDAAERADPNSPYVALYRAAFAIDSYRADDAIAAAREALRRYRARGGIYASLSESKGTGSYIAGAFRFLGLEEWARYYADRTYDPFASTAVFDRALSRVPDPYVFEHGYTPFDSDTGGDSAAVSDVFQGLRLDPLAIAGTEKGLQLTRQKFIELDVAASLVASGNTVSLSQSASLNGVLLAPVPLAFSVTASHDRLAVPLVGNDLRRGDSIQGFFGLKPSPYDNLVINLSYAEQRHTLPGASELPPKDGRLFDRSAAAYAIYSHQFDRENIVSFGGGYLEAKNTLGRKDFLFIPDPSEPTIPIALLLTDYRETTKFKGWLGFANYAVGLGPLDVQAGGEYFSTRANSRQTLDIITLPDNGTASIPESGRNKADQYRAYADLRFLPSDRFIVQAQAALSGRRVRNVGNANHFDISLGAAVEPLAGHWLRAGYVRATNITVPFTLAPTAVVGLRQADAPLPNGARSKSIIARWETEWSLHVFTSVEWQHQNLDALSFSRANFIDPIEKALFTEEFGVQSVDVGPSQLDRVSASASVWLTGNIGLRGVYSFTRSEVKDSARAGQAIPFTPRHFARGQVIWTNRDRFKINAGVSYLGARTVDLVGTRASHAWLGDVQLTMEPSDQSFQFTTGLFNIFNEDVLLIPGVGNFGRTLAASLEFRF